MIWHSHAPLSYISAFQYTLKRGIHVMEPGFGQAFSRLIIKSQHCYQQNKFNDAYVQTPRVITCINITISHLSIYFSFSSYCLSLGGCCSIMCISTNCMWLFLDMFLIYLKRKISATFCSENILFSNLRYRGRILPVIFLHFTRWCDKVENFNHSYHTWDGYGSS